MDFEQRYHFGAELWFQNMIALRAGYKWNYDLENFAFGAGFKQTVGGQTFSVDVSYSLLKSIDGVALFDSPLRVSIAARSNPTDPKVVHFFGRLPGFAPLQSPFVFCAKIDGAYFLVVIRPLHFRSEKTCRKINT